jgi:hypothetical protein
MLKINEKGEFVKYEKFNKGHTYMSSSSAYATTPPGYNCPFLFAHAAHSF